MSTVTTSTRVSRSRAASVRRSFGWSGGDFVDGATTGTSSERRARSVILALLTLENLLRLSQPLVIGLAINDLLASSGRGLLLFAAQHLAYMLVGAARQMYDTRALAGAELREVAGDGPSARRTGLVDFEETVPLAMQTLFSIFGALLLLSLYDWTLLPVCLLFVVPVALLNAAYGRQVSLLSWRLKEVQLQEAIDAEDRRGTQQHIEMLSSWRVKLSDAAAIRFAMMELFVLGLLTTVLVRYCTSGSGLWGGDVLAGDIFAVFGYVLIFILGLDAIPDVVARGTAARQSSEA